MSHTAAPLTRQYDSAAGRWRDKMRALGYYDGYLGFLSDPACPRPEPKARVIDAGAGTAAFAEAWVAVKGAPEHLTLLDPSRAMLERGAAALAARNVEAETVVGLLGETELAPADHVLSAHVIEHCPDPGLALKHLATLVRQGGWLHLVVSKPHWCNAIIWLQWRHRTFADTEIAALLGAAGFDVASTYTFPSGPPSRTSRGIIARRL
jgi:2-polyprenyl-3-methyl-5-hydroxy-6-metoxy-1,4-benzoquinol methylase